MTNEPDVGILLIFSHSVWRATNELSMHRGGSQSKVASFLLAHPVEWL